MAEHAHHDYQEKLLDVIDKAKTFFFELYFIQRALEVNLENVNLLNQFVQSARTRYAVGTVTNQDLLKANVELAKLANEQITLEQKEETAKAMLNTLLNRPAQAALGKTAVNEEPSEEYDLEKLQQIALQNRPMVRHDSLSIVQTQVSLALAKQQYQPDFRVSLEYVTSPLDGFRGWTGMVGMSIPFSPWTLRKRSGEIPEAEANLQVNQAIYQNTKNMILFSVKDALVKVQTARRLVNLYRETVLPQSKQSLQATFAAYQTKQADFLTLLDSLRYLTEEGLQANDAAMRAKELEEELEISTVHCNGCVNTIRTSLEHEFGELQIDADIKEHQITVTVPSEDIPGEGLKEILTETGFNVSEFSEV